MGGEFNGELAGTEELAAREAGPEVDDGKLAGAEDLAACEADSGMNDVWLMSKVTTSA